MGAGLFLLTSVDATKNDTTTANNTTTIPCDEYYNEQVGIALFIFLITISFLVILFMSLRFSDKENRTLSVYLWFMWSRKNWLAVVYLHLCGQCSNCCFFVGMYPVIRRIVNEAAETIDCTNTDMNTSATRVLFCSLLAFCLYRYSICFIMNVATRDTKIVTNHFIFPEYGLFRAAWVNFKLNRTEVTYPQEWVQSIGTLWGSFPLLIIQLYFGIAIYKFETSIIISILLSILALMYECRTSAKYWSKFGNPTHNNRDGTNNLNTIWYYFMFRVFDISHRVFVIVVSLCVLGSTTVLYGAFAEFSVACFATGLTNELSNRYLLYQTCFQQFLCFFYDLIA